MNRRPNYSQLDVTQKVYFLASGGRDSTAMVLEAFALGIKGVMVWNNTKFNHSSKKVLDALSNYTGFPLKVVTYEGKDRAIDVLKKSFLKIPDAVRIAKIHRYRWRNQFVCCHKFKENPMRQYIKSLKDENCILVMGIKGGDGSFVRRWRLSELRAQGTFIRVHKTGLKYYYPLRDCREKDVVEILREHGFNQVKGSGCSICPIFLVFESMHKKDPDTWERSMRFAKRLGVTDFPMANQTQIQDFCSGD
ncbi:MAG: hypothetical protein ACW99G_21630 [Candidatus Thorarchaeota archaeon]|jgi:3'-phosphoadenosine 5'-phosphosulfate sulfotransferase (PAPS reductase)/FAD synthetase